DRLRSLEYPAQHPDPVPAAVGSRLRRRQLAVALLPAPRRDRDPDLGAVAAVRRPARTLGHPEAVSSRCNCDLSAAVTRSVPVAGSTPASTSRATVSIS